MNYLDIIIGIILLLFAFGGFKNGIIREAFGLAAFIGGIYGAVRLSDVVGEKLSNLINVSHEWMAVISFIVVFIVLALLINLIGKGISKLVESLNLGFIDKIGGSIFGVAQGFLLVGVLILVLEFFGLKNVINDKTRSESKLYTTSEKVATLITDYKDVVIDGIDEGVEKLDDAINSKNK